MKKLYIVRGLPGSGKTKFANTICDTVISTDDYFMVNGEYKFRPEQLSKAHAFCQSITERIMQEGNDIAVANTFTTEWEMTPYFKMAEKLGYMVFTIVVEHRHDGKQVHNVPAETIERMNNRFQLKL